MTDGRRALYRLATSRYISLSVQVATTIVIARLLTPSEIGVFSIGAAFVGLGHLLRDFGSGTFIIQEKELNLDKIRAAFSVTLLLGWSIAAALLVAAPFAADFYNQEGIQDVLSLLSVNFFLLPFGSIPLAYAQRELNFTPSSIATVGSTLVATAVSIYLAYTGHSYMSLAWGAVCGTITTVALVTLFRPKGLPFVLPGRYGIRRVLAFGSRISAITVLDKLSALTPELVLGKTQDLHAVGLFSRTQGTANIFNQFVMMIITPIVTPLFAERFRSGGAIRPIFLHGLFCVTGLAWAFSANLAVLAQPFVLALYGDQWESIVPLIQIWSVSLILGYMTSLVDQVLVGTGNINRLMRYAVFINTYQIFGFFVAGLFGIEAILVVIVFAPILRLLWLWRDIKHICGINGKDLVEVVKVSLIPAILSAAMAGLAVQLTARYFTTSSLILLATGATFSALVWLLLIWRRRHPLWEEGLEVLRRLPR